MKNTFLRHHGFNIEYRALSPCLVYNPDTVSTSVTEVHDTINVETIPAFAADQQGIDSAEADPI
jgi:hypothetical protein